MRDLSFVGVSGDGARLLLVGPDGAEFSVPLDDRLAATISRRHEHAVGAAEPALRRMKFDPITGTPTPREIQTRVRHGMSPAEIAAAAAVPVEQVERFARTVLVERSHMADAAKKAFVRGGPGEPGELLQLVLSRLGPPAPEPDALDWEAWRSEDGRWTVTLRYPEGAAYRSAWWIFDPVARSVHPADDNARALVGSGAAGAPGRPREQATPGGPVSSREADSAAPAVPGASRHQAAAVPAASGPEPDPAHPAGSRRQWDEAHPAARAAARAQQRAATSPPPPEPTQASAPAETGEPGPGAASPAPAATPAARAESADSGPPQWEELLFGTPDSEPR